jgi:5-(aminomethyl)-3-furanmethanol phosphate kinase
VRPEGSRAISVVKIGGGITALPGTLQRVCSAVQAAAQIRRLLIVPGGGPFADSVRESQQRLGLSDEAAHWMAILAMDQYAEVLAERIAGSVLLQEPGDIAAAVLPGRPGVLAPSRWMRSADVLPHSWDVTSDSIAAFIAGALDAERLILIKPSGECRGVDPYFWTALPSNLPSRCLGADELDQLDASLSAPSAADGPGSPGRCACD